MPSPLSVEREYAPDTARCVAALLALLMRTPAIGTSPMSTGASVKECSNDSNANVRA
jgi:hypothetical protein